ncbi:MAG: glycoside hydrolase family 16 protein [Acidobacteriaceae bacterium]|nr:glycoside hydrolase family 16 protein [Acidobacteriaceae bacterium]
MPSAKSSSPDSSPSNPTPLSGANEFNFAGYTWEKDSGTAPPVGNVNGNTGTFSSSNVSVGSELVLTLSQEQQGNGILSTGAEVHSKQSFGYGTFEFTSRVSAAVSGTTASGFLFTNNSQTEIDMEQTGDRPYAVDCTNWSGLSNYQDTEVNGFDQLQPHDFKIVWQPTEVDWYVDGQLIVTHIESVPSAPAPFLFNVWGTNNSAWGGWATPGTTRYMHITSFRYTPLAS